MHISIRVIIVICVYSSSSLSFLLVWFQPPRHSHHHHHHHHHHHRFTPSTTSATVDAITTTHWMMATTTGTTTNTSDNADHTNINDSDKNIEPSQEPSYIPEDDTDTKSFRDAYAYHHYASMGVDLSSGHLISSSDDKHHVFTVQRSVRDIDENRRRTFLYTVPFTTTTTTSSSLSSLRTTLTTPPSLILPIPPQEVHSNVIFRLPSPSGKHVAIFRNDPDVTTTTPPPVILELWEHHGISLTRRIALNPTSGGQQRRHGKIVCDPNGAFGIPSWNVAETCLVYIAEQTLPSMTSFFATGSPPSKQRHDSSGSVDTTLTRTTTGQQHVLGIGQFEHYGEKYRDHILYHSIYCVHVTTGNIGRVQNVPIQSRHDTKNSLSTTIQTPPLTLGQVQFCPPLFRDEIVEESIVYTGWGDPPKHDNKSNDQNATTAVTKRLGFIYCQQRPCQLYHSKVTHLLHQLSSLDCNPNDDDDRADAAHRMDPPFVTLTNDMKLSHSPRFNYHRTAPNYTDTRMDHQALNLVYLTSRQGFDTHAGCLALGTMTLSHIFDLYDHRCCNSTSSTGNTSVNNSSDASIETVSSTTLVVEEVWAPMIATTKRSTGTKYDNDNTVAGLSFPGLFLQQLPQSCFLSSDCLLATTQWGSCQKVVQVSLKSGMIRLISIQNEHPYSSDELLCCNHVGAVVCSKTPNQPARVHFIAADQLVTADHAESTGATDRGQALRVPSTEIGIFSPIASSKIALTGQQHKILLPVLSNSFEFDIRAVPVTTNVDGGTCRHQIQSILLLPSTAKTTTSNEPSIDATITSSSMLPPLIIIPHGGPHSASTTNFAVSYAYLCGYGRYAILLVNYRGSTGYGQASIQSLPTNIGTQDVQDVVDATNDVCSSGLVDVNRIGICGGSHGGFLTAHLTGQYPNMFQAAVMRNPVVNLPSMVTSTDIPDWCYVEACGSYDFDAYRPPKFEEIQTLYNVSPIQHIQNVQTPTLVALGLKDLRVPPSQGMEWYYSLRGRSFPPPPPTKLLLYENDDHAIDGVASEADHWVHIKQWFDQYL